MSRYVPVASGGAAKAILDHVAAGTTLDDGRPGLKTAGHQTGCSRHGVMRVVVVPYFLTLGLHLQRDLPRLVEEARRANPGLEIEVTAPLDGHPAMAEALVDRARTCKPD